MLSLLLAFPSCNRVIKNKQDNLSLEQDHFVPKVSVMVLKKSRFSLQIFSNGILDAVMLTKLSFQTSGQLRIINYQDGDKVKKGDVIAILDQSESIINLKKAKLSFMDAENDLHSLLLGYGVRQKDTSSIDGKLLKSLKMQSGYTKALLNLQSAKLNYQHTVLKAPFTSTIADIKDRVSEWIYGFKPFCSLLKEDKFVADFSITTSELPYVSIGEPVKVFLVAYDSLFFKGHVAEINPEVNKGGLISVRAALDDYSKQKNSVRLLNGMYVSVIVEKKIPNSFVIPKSALVLRGDRKVVFTYNKGKAIWNEVTIKGENSTSYRVVKGLHEGDTVIIHGAINLAHDAPVKLN